MEVRPFEVERTPEGTVYRVRARGQSVLTTPLLNRGTAFTHAERATLGLTGLLPSAHSTLDGQVRRVYEQYRRQVDDLTKNVVLTALRERNAVLFYRLLAEHLTEMLPIVYTPTIGRAIQRYSHEYRRPRGIFLSIDRVDEIEPALRNFGLGADDVDLLVATDSEGILGIGDWGVGGIEISIGKLAVYTAAAGIDPHRVIPVVLDVGTDNLGLLNDPMYLGERHSRVRGDRYDEFIDAYVTTAAKLFPNAILHWEDFGAGNARRILHRYAEEYCTFNDDMQGTAAVTLAALVAAIRAAGTRLRDQRVVILGPGTAGIGIADVLVDEMVRDGLDRAEAMRRFWCVGRRGLLTDDRADRLRDYQVPYATPAADVASWSRTGPGGTVSLADVVAEARPTILIGTSTTSGAFTEQIVKTMAAHTERPIIFPLSNPTDKAEALPADLVAWSDGRALIATGSPFPPVSYGGTTYTVAQANNALVFPGLGLGTIVAKSRRISDRMLAASATAVADLVDAGRRGAPLLPPVDNLRMVSATVAVEVAKAAAEEGLAEVELTDPIQQVHTAMWQPEYPRIEAI